MKWVLSQRSLDHHRWLLQDEGGTTQFTYHAGFHSIRIRGKNNRLFFLEVTGFLQKKIQLLSEYGVVVGETQWLNNLKKGSLLLDNQKYFYSHSNNQLSLYNKNKTLLAETTIEFSKNADAVEQFALLFSTAWVYSSAGVMQTEDLLVA